MKSKCNGERGPAGTINAAINVGGLGDEKPVAKTPVVKAQSR